MFLFFSCQILAVSALIHHEVSLDKAAPKQNFQYHFCGKFHFRNIKDLHLIKNNYQSEHHKTKATQTLPAQWKLYSSQSNLYSTYVLLLTGHLSEGPMNSLFSAEHFSLESPYSQYIYFFLQVWVNQMIRCTLMISKMLFEKRYFSHDLIIW